MGMDVGGNKGGAMATMNVVPLIDILLVLLIIFMGNHAFDAEGSGRAGTAAGAAEPGYATASG